AYYLASAFGEIYLQPSGDVGLTGLLAEAPFVRGTLDKLGIVARFAARGEYKNAINMFTERRFTEPHRQATTRLITSQFDQIVRARAVGERGPGDRRPGPAFGPGGDGREAGRRPGVPRRGARQARDRRRQARATEPRSLPRPGGPAVGHRGHRGVDPRRRRG